MSEMVPADSLSLYLHIPFCRHRCAYCDFNTYSTLGALKDSYGDALAQEIAQVGRAAREHGEPPAVHTIFLGGGTPSLMTPEALAKIVGAVRDHFQLSPEAEISMEANPGTVDQAYLGAVREIGINRLSFGVQSAVASELALLEREHSFDTVVEAVEMSRAAGFDNFNLDLIYGVPGQTLDTWQQSLTATAALSPAHFSLYCLTIEPGTPMQRWLKNGLIEPPDPDLAADQYELICGFLEERGFEHYEISNWAKPGHQCQHNLTYWRNRPYLGLGAGAHGFAGGYRYHVVKQPRVYIRRMESGDPQPFPISAAAAEHHLVDRAEAMSDTIITQLRLLKEGLDMDAFQANFGQTIDEAYGDTTSQLVEWGMLRRDGSRLLMTDKGRFLSNQIFYRFV